MSNEIKNTILMAVAAIMFMAAGHFDPAWSWGYHLFFWPAWFIALNLMKNNHD